MQSFDLATKKAWAKQRREIGQPIIKAAKEMLCDCMACENQEMEQEISQANKKHDRIIMLIASWAIVILASLLLAKIARASEYTDNQIVNAIRKAEGVPTYGIKNVKCSSEKECRQICLRTVKNNRRRFKEYGYRKYPEFVQFLGSRYCPTTGGNLSASERRLNGNWVRNVNYFLQKDA